MATATIADIKTRSSEKTRQLGREIGARLPSGVVIRLTGELGSGKTCFVLEVPEGYDITSPTYALIHEYPGRLPLVHVDLYRVSDEMDAESIGLMEFFGPKTVVAVEWADRLGDDFWPQHALRIDFQANSDETRCIRLIGYGLQIGNLIKEVLAFWNAAQDKPLAL
jgi:tRNA threonylcarbamoyladenosine biosynthesis protein TsaE